MKYILLFFILSIPLSILAQHPERPFEKIVYPKLNPEWHVVNFDSEMENEEFDGYNNFAPIAGFEVVVDNDAIFELFFRQNSLEPTGTYIQKRDLNDGELLWRKYLGYPLDPQQILGRDVLINSNSNVEVICQVKCDPYDINYPLLGVKNMALYKVELDKEQGDVISEVNYVCNDTSYLQTNFDGFILNDVSKFYAIEDTFFFTQSEWNGSGWQRLIFKLDDDYRTDNVLKGIHPKKYNCQGDLPMLYNDSTKIVFDSNCDTKQIEMTYIDHDFSSIKTVISDSLSIALNDLQVKEFDPVKRWFLLENVINFENKEIELLIINDEGSLLKRIIMPTIYNRNYSLLEWSNLDSTILLSTMINFTDNDVPFVNLDVLKSGVNGSIDLLHSFTPTDSLRFFSFINLAMSDDEYYYLELHEGSLASDYSIDRRAFARSLMKIKKQYILNPSTSTQQVALNKLKCYPNPTNNLLHIDNVNHPVTLTIMDINGQIIKTAENVQHKISIEDLSTGMYILYFRNEHISESHRIMKID